MGVRGVIVAGERNLSRAAQGGDGFAIRLRPACGERQLLFFVLLHLRIGEGVFALIIFAILLSSWRWPGEWSISDTSVTGSR